MGESGSESRSDSQSDFGVKISIQALKGHPFVILEGNDAKKKYVPAPKQSDFEQTDDQSYDRYIFIFLLYVLTFLKKGLIAWHNFSFINEILRCCQIN